MEFSNDDKNKIFKYTLRKVLPALRQIEQEQREELQLECRTKGAFFKKIIIINV